MIKIYDESRSECNSRGVKMNKKYSEMIEEIAKLEEQLDAMPKGVIRCYKDKGKYTKWYTYDEEKRIVLHKSEKEKASLLAEKQYLMERLKVMKNKKDAFEGYLKQCDSVKKVEKKYLSDESPYRKLLTSKYRPMDEILLEWQSQPYEKNEDHPEHLKYKTPSGHIVRSKSELLIASALYEAEIPFRYECKLVLANGSFCHPDFTVRGLNDGRIRYWEHFGRMDDSDYLRKTAWKINEYASNDIIPGHDLLMTFETQDKPLTIDLIEEVIERIKAGF